MKKLDELRLQIDSIDQEIVSLFEKRLEICKEIGKTKKENNIAILNTKREEEVIKKNSSLIKEEFKNSYIKLIKLIIEESKKVQ